MPRERLNREPKEFRATFTKLSHVAKNASHHIRRDSAIYGKTIKTLWANTEATFIHTNDGVLVSKKAIHEFWDKGNVANQAIDRSRLQDISQIAISLEREYPIWRNFANFFIHDIHWLEPNALYFQYFTALENKTYHGKPALLSHRKLRHIQTFIKRSDHYAALQAYPTDYIEAIADHYQGKPITKDLFLVKNIASDIAFYISMLHPLDYEIVEGKTPSNKNKNRIILDVPATLLVKANKATFFSIAFNLINNTSRIIAQTQFDQADTNSSSDRILGFILPKKPNTIHIRAEHTNGLTTFSVEDDGPGIQGLPAGENVFDRIGKPGTPTAYDPFRHRGQGLHIIQFATQFIGGTITGTNKPEGGAKFTLTIPK